MKYFNEYLEESGYNAMSSPPKPKVVYYAYKSGEVKEFDNQDDAKKFSPNIERKIVDHPDFEEYKKISSQLYSTAVYAWYSDLRKQYQDLPDDVFNLCYSNASERADGSGYDELANYLPGVIDFAQRILSTQS